MELCGKCHTYEKGKEEIKDWEEMGEDKHKATDK